MILELPNGYTPNRVRTGNAGVDQLSGTRQFQNVANFISLTMTKSIVLSQKLLQKKMMEGEGRKNVKGTGKNTFGNRLTFFNSFLSLGQTMMFHPLA